MRAQKIAEALYPFNLVLITVVLSFSIWCLPEIEGIRRGFNDRAAITATGLSVLAFWYGSIYSLSRLGFALGSNARPSATLLRTISFDRAATYKLLVVIGAIGLAASYYQIAKILGVSGMLYSLSRNTANDLKEALYTDYSVGLVSLRYVSAICGGIGLWRIVTRRYSPIDAIAIVSWLGTAMLSSRLSLIWGVLTALTLWLTSIRHVTGKFVVRLAAVGLFATLALWTLNYSRNANYYKAKGTGNFALSGLGEAVTYLGSPFQVSLGVANHISEALDGTQSKDLVDWDQSLTTDSAFERSIGHMGIWAFPYMFVTVFFYSVVAGACFQMRGTWLFIGFPIADYAFAEIWRVDLFSQGIFYTNLFVGIAVPLTVFALAQPRAIRRMRTHYSGDCARPTVAP